MFTNELIRPNHYVLHGSRHQVVLVYIAINILIYVSSGSWGDLV